MKCTLIILLLTLFLSGCELIVIGTKKPKPIEINQQSPIGAIFLFKTELDSNNIPAATQLLAQPEGSLYLAFERYEMYEEIARIQRLIAYMPITYIVPDSASFTESSAKIDIVFDYLRTVSFTTTKIKNNWYITGYREWSGAF